MTPYYDDGQCAIYHGDCREIMPSFAQDSIRLLWTDPPYGHSNQDGDLQAARVRDAVKGARTRQVESIANDSAEAMRAAVEGALSLALPLLKGDCCCCCCSGGGGPTVTFAWLANHLDREGFEFFHAVVWDKSGRGDGLGWRFRRNYEFVMVAHKRGRKLAWVNQDRAVPNIWRPMPTKNAWHPTEKPVELVAQFIDLTTWVGDTVLDPFMGSGTTLVAAKRLGRKAIGIEIEEKYCEIAAKRLAQGALDLFGEQSA